MFLVKIASKGTSLKTQFLPKRPLFYQNIPSGELRVTKDCGRPAVEVSGEIVEGTLHFSRVHFLTEDLPSQTKMEASGEGNFSVIMNTSSSALFQEEKLGLGLYPRGDVHVTIQMGMLVHFFLGLKFRQILLYFLGGGVSKAGAIF